MRLDMRHCVQWGLIPTPGMYVKDCSQRVALGVLGVEHCFVYKPVKSQQQNVHCCHGAVCLQPLAYRSVAPLNKKEERECTRVPSL